jgi:DNA repair protein RadD
MTYELRPYQKTCVEKGLDVFKRGAREIIVAPCAAGKSLIIANIAKELPGKTIVFQPSKELLEQNYEKMKMYDIEDVGIFSASMNQKTVGKITFATIGTVYNKPEMWGDFDNVLCDEADLVGKEGMYNEFIEAHGGSVLGLTATPFRMSSFNDMNTGYRTVVAKFLTRTRPKIFNKIAHTVQISEIKDQYWCPLEYLVNEKYKPDEIKLNSTGMDFDDNDLRTYNSKMNIIEVIKDSIKTLDKRHILVFTRFVEEAVALQRQLHEKGITSAIVSADTPKKEREYLVADFKSGKIKVMLNVGIFLIGFDFPELDCVIIGRPMMSVRSYLQCIGRCIRPHPDKQKATIIDICGNMRRFGRIETFEFVENENNGLPRLKSEVGFLTGVNLVNGQDLEEVKAGDTITFGKFKGKKVSEVDLGYLQWGAENLKGAWKKRFEEEVSRRKNKL